MSEAVAGEATAKRYRCGTKASYHCDKCRCTPCSRAAWRYELMREWLAHQGKSLTVPSLGFKRRVEALMCMGWSQAEIAPLVGLSTQQEVSAKRCRHSRIKRSLHERMAEVYDELHMQFSTGAKANWVKVHAARQGFAPPLAWDDIDDPDEVPQGAACHVDECDDEAVKGGWCMKHYRRWTRTGDPQRKKKTTPSYGAMYLRVRRNRGSASEHTCVGCMNQPAICWSYDQTDPNPVYDKKKGRYYSLDLAHYVPYCGPCHIRIIRQGIPVLQEAS